MKKFTKNPGSRLSLIIKMRKINCKKYNNSTKTALTKFAYKELVTVSSMCRDFILINPDPWS